MKRLNRLLIMNLEKVEKRGYHKSVKKLNRSLIIIIKLLNINKQKNRTLEATIDKFHCAVSKGPLFICTCCDQLWYKHSVCCAENTRLTNPNTIKHFQNIISVDNKEWLCQSCNRYLKKIKYHLLSQME